MSFTDPGPPIDRRVYVLFLIFGMASWIAVNGIYAELPFIVGSVPEGSSISAIITVVIQIGNVGPLCYGLLYKRFGQVVARPTIYVIFLIGIASCIMLAFLWHVTVALPSKNKDISLPLIALSGGLAIVDCTSSLVFWPFASRFPPVYITALAAGEALSSLVPGLLSWIQAANSGGICAEEQSALFPPAIYFGLLAALLLASCYAFSKLDRVSETNRPLQPLETIQAIQSSSRRGSRSGDYHRISESDSKSEHSVKLKIRSESSSWRRSDSIDMNAADALKASRSGIFDDDDDDGTTPTHHYEPQGPRITWIVYAVIAVIGVIQNGIFPAILPLATMIYTRCTYGATNSTALVLAPFFAFLIAYFPINSEITTTVSTFGLVLVTGYMTTVAFLGHSAPLAGSALGGAVHGGLIIATSCAIAYIKSAAYTLVRKGYEEWECKESVVDIVMLHESDTEEKWNEPIGDKDGRARDLQYTRYRLRKAGVAQQVGSLVGATSIFLMMKFSDWFPKAY